MGHRGQPSKPCMKWVASLTSTYLQAIPLFVTSIMVPFLLALLRTIRSSDGKDERLSTSAASKLVYFSPVLDPGCSWDLRYIFSVMFSPTIMLLIGGFTIASALSKTSIDRVLITRVLSFAGTKPSTVLLSVMGVSCFASMWISNVAAPTLCFTLIRVRLVSLSVPCTNSPNFCSQFCERSPQGRPLRLV